MISRWNIVFAMLVLQNAIICNSLHSKDLEGKAIKWSEAQKIFRSADKITVTQYNVVKKDGKISAESKIVYTSTKVEEINSFADAVEVAEPEKTWYCWCIGSFPVRLYKNDKMIAEITNHHGESIRCNLCVGNATLKNNIKFLNWFYRRGIAIPIERI